tara:strand:- start:183 stop:776 length:594 start_codon:yes stop_codon:yes gene_type:complete
MSDCDCEKKNVDETWLDKNDYGDEFLSEESFKIIRRIIRDKEYYTINQDAIFNLKLDENEINEMTLDDVKIDYSYLKNDNFRGMDDRQDEIELLEETGNTSDSTESVLSQEEAEIMESIEKEENTDEKMLDDILEEETETETEKETTRYDTDLTSMTEDEEELKEIVKNLSRKREKNNPKYDFSVSEEKLNELLDED